MIKNNNFNSLSTTLQNQLKISKSYSNKNVSPGTLNCKGKTIEDTIEISTSVDVNNEARINEVKEKLQNNQYKVDTNLIAKALVSELSLLK